MITLGSGAFKYACINVFTTTNSSSLYLFLDSPYTGSYPINYFLIRRYVDDASQILIEGFRPTGTEGPYIITPEYVTPSLNKNVDTFLCFTNVG